MKKKTKKIYIYQKRFYQYLYLRLIQSKVSPNRTAGSVALGLFVGLFMPAGTQVVTLIIIFPILALFKIHPNIALTGLFTLISNPLTDLPLYASYIFIGSLIIGSEAKIELSNSVQFLFDLFVNLWNSSINILYHKLGIHSLEPQKYDIIWNTFINSWKNALSYFFLCSIITAIIGSILGFFITKKLILNRKNKKQKLKKS